MDLRDLRWFAMVPLRVLREPEDNSRTQRPETYCGISLTRELWYLDSIKESRAPGGGPTSTGISEDQIWTSEGEGPESDLYGIRAKLWC